MRLEEITREELENCGLDFSNDEIEILLVDGVVVREQGEKGDREYKEISYTIEFDYTEERELLVKHVMSDDYFNSDGREVIL